MQKARIKGKDIIITEEAFKKMKSRFNIKNFKVGKDTWDDDMFVNDTSCYLCCVYDTSCTMCPFGVFEKNTVGCFEAIKSILTPYQRRVFFSRIYLYDDKIGYFIANKKAAEKVINKIYSCINEAFKKMKKERK